MNNSYKISEIKAGSQGEFRKLIDGSADDIFALALKITADEEDARDIVQDSFIRLWEKRKTLKEKDSLLPFLKKITVNKCLDHLRKKKNHNINTASPELLNTLASSVQADSELQNQELFSLLKSLGSGLSPKQKVVFTMVELEQMSHDEVANITGMTKNSIKSNLRHAKRRLEEYVRYYLK